MNRILTSTTLVVNLCVINGMENVKALKRSHIKNVEKYCYHCSLAKLV